MENAQLEGLRERRFSEMDPMISSLGRRTLLGLACLVGFADAAQNALTDVQMAVPGPSLPVLPLTARQRIGLSVGTAMRWHTGRTDRLVDSSLGPVDVATHRQSVGGQLHFRVENAFWGGEGIVGVQESKLLGLQAMGQCGYALVRPDRSVLAWGGLGMGQVEARSSSLQKRRVITPLETHGDGGPQADTSVVTWRESGDAGSRLALVAAGGLSVSLRDDQVLSPYAAVRMQYGPTVPLNASSVMADVGVRSRLRHRVAMRAGIGATHYLGSWFHGVNLTAHLGLNIVLRTPPEWWAHSRMPQVEVEEAQRKAERDRADHAESEQLPAGNGGRN